jgi:hypothetical protein
LSSTKKRPAVFFLYDDRIAGESKVKELEMQRDGALENSSTISEQQRIHLRHLHFYELFALKHEQKKIAYDGSLQISSS